MNGFNYNPPPAMEFYNPEASLYGMFSCTINKDLEKSFILLRVQLSFFYVLIRIIFPYG